MRRIRARRRRRAREQRLSDISRAVRRDGLTYLGTQKLLRLEDALRRTEGLGGDVVEFGVALGGSAIVLAHQMGPHRSFVGFDVFEMIPPPSSPKDDAKSRERYERIRSGASTGIGGDTYYGYRSDLLSDVRHAFERHGLSTDSDGITLHKGLFEDTWPTASISAVSMAHIDCDWYEPVRFCLGSCADVVVPGGILVIDDYYDYGGCRTAVDEFLGTDPEWRFEDGPNPYLVRSPGPTTSTQ